MKRCLGLPGQRCGKVGNWPRGGRCPACAREKVRLYERKRQAAKSIKYNAFHRRQRLSWEIKLGMQPQPCARCGELVHVTSAWDLDHLPDGTSRPSHARCNRSASRGGLGEVRA